MPTRENPKRHPRAFWGGVPPLSAKNGYGAVCRRFSAPGTPASREALLTILETLLDALFVVDDAAAIVYANASAQMLTGATHEGIVGRSLWSGAPQLVSFSPKTQKT
jgi:PAS domain-containing protein